VIRKRTFVFILGLAVCRISFGQDYHFSGVMQTMVYVNPAYAALPSSGEIGLTYRNQWPGIPATFVTYGAAFIMPVKSLNSGIGVSVTNDMQGSGVINRTSASLLYGYLLKINNNWQVGAGISASWVMKRFNADQLVFRSDLLNDLGYSYGNVTFDNYSKSYPDFSVGLIARKRNNFSFGISASHVTRPPDSFSDLNSSRLPLKYTAFISGMFSGGRQNKELTIEPALFYSLQRDNQEFIWGSQFNIESKFMVGAWVRQNLRMNFDALILSAGISWEKYNISYSYDVNLKKISFLSTKMAAHEVTFLYRFEYKEEHKVKRFRKSECPAYKS
jgi:type IX secretion system PorP/SprF family membrane protein